MQLAVSMEKVLGGFHFAADFALSGSRIGVFGPSGSGKSTLMHLLAGLLTPDSGMIRLDNTVLFDHASGVNLPPEQRRIGVVFQHSYLFPHLSVRRNLLYGWRRIPEAARHIEPETIIAALHLNHLLNRGVKQLSGGERQRVALGRTILTCPRLILMDEPLSGLDQELKFQIIPYLNSVFTEFEIPLLYISHSFMEMRLMTEQVLVFEQGKIKNQLQVEELTQSANTVPPQGYVNVLRLGRPLPHGHLWRYQWGDVGLILSEYAEQEHNMFALDAREILLVTHHPGAASAPNLLFGAVRKLFIVDNLVRVELQCGIHPLIVEIAAESMQELHLAPGKEIVALIRASAFKKIIS